MKKIRKTKKLWRAVRILQDEQIADSSALAWFEGLERRRFRVEDIYKAMVAFGYRWDARRECWKRPAFDLKYIQKMLLVVRVLDRTITEDIDEDGIGE